MLTSRLCGGRRFSLLGSFGGRSGGGSGSGSSSGGGWQQC